MPILTPVYSNPQYVQKAPLFFGKPLLVPVEHAGKENQKFMWIKLMLRGIVNNYLNLPLGRLRFAEFAAKVLYPCANPESLNLKPDFVLILKSEI